MYKITDYSYKKAKALRVDIKPSTNKKKKIDVFKHGKKVASIGAIGYSDYPTFIKEKGKTYAEKRREQYYRRHARDSKASGYYAKKILW